MEHWLPTVLPMLLHVQLEMVETSPVRSGVGSLISPQLVPAVVGLLEAIAVAIAWEIIWLFFKQLCRSVSPKLGHLLGWIVRLYAYSCLVLSMLPE